MTEKVIFAKDLVRNWLNQVQEKEYSVTIHPREDKGFHFPERFIRTITDTNKNWAQVSIVEGKLVIKGKDPIKMAGLIIQIGRFGYTAEE